MTNSHHINLDDAYKMLALVNHLQDFSYRKWFSKGVFYLLLPFMWLLVYIFLAMLFHKFKKSYKPIPKVSKENYAELKEEQVKLRSVIRQKKLIEKNEIVEKNWFLFQLIYFVVNIQNLGFTHLTALTQELEKLNPPMPTKNKFKALTEDQIWNDRSKAYLYRA
ncbi:MAG: hypothetical protein EAZ97_13235 [Bacteroidetes bacterium]|nr:MAG: hypothetical protein EAZ97_13235 [Bacteroidota bacterium]